MKRAIAIIDLEIKNEKDAVAVWEEQVASLVKAEEVVPGEEFLGAKKKQIEDNIEIVKANIVKKEEILVKLIAKEEESM